MGHQKPSVPENIDKLNFIHISDIHFRKSDNRSNQVLNQDVRDQLELVAASVGAELTNVHGILVTGDLAFRGDAQEYSESHEWIQKLCSILKCPSQNVWMVPGNHDVDQSFIDGAPLLHSVQTSISKLAPEIIDHELSRQLAGKEANSIFFGPVANFNNLASKFNCSFSASKPYWEHSVKLNDGSDLVIRGLNSTLISNKEDHQDTHKMVVGACNCALTEKSGVAYMVLCHHPPDWLRDEKYVTQYLDNRAALQLYGHKHDQKIDHLNGVTLKVYAGAIHPTRSEHPFEPRFNFLSLYVTVEEVSHRKQRNLVVELRPYLWKDSLKKFEKESGRESDHPSVYKMKIGNFAEIDKAASSSEARQIEPEASANRSDPLNVMSGHEEKKTTSYNAPRRLAFRFMSLSHVERLGIVTKMKLYENQDEGISDVELFKRVFKRAHESKLLSQLWQEVETLHSDPELSPNPFD